MKNVIEIVSVILLALGVLLALVSMVYRYLLHRSPEIVDGTSYVVDEWTYTFCCWSALSIVAGGAVYTAYRLLALFTS